MASIFTRIIKREIPAHIVAENDHCLAFLDINPLVIGHTLVIPKQEIDYIFDLDTSTLTSLHVFARDVAAAIKKGLPCPRVGVAVIGLEVPHAHIHLVPLRHMSDMNFANPKLRLSPEELADTAQKIRSAF